MKSRTLILSLLTLSVAYPINDNEEAIQKEIAKLREELYDAAYKKNFKDIVLKYIVSVNKGLTFSERDKVRDIIDDLLQNVANDFRMVLNDKNESEDVMTRILDRKLRDPSFDEIHKFLVLQMPNTEDRQLLRLAYKLQNNLVDARKKIDRVIRDSKMAQIENSLS